MSLERHRRVAIVTGAAGGLGASTAQRLARRGVAVAVVDLDVERAEPVAAAIRDAGGESVAVGADVSDHDQVDAAVAEIHRALGVPGILVNNAGVLRDNLLFKMSDSDWDTVMSVHLRGSFLMSRAAQAHMVDAGWGRIVNISSTSALGNRGQTNYAAAKAGLQGFTKAAALELGRYGITVNAVAPGVTDSAMTRATAERLGMGFADYERSVAEHLAIPRVGHPDDVANAVDFFAGEDSGYISGQVLYVAGGPVD